MDKKWYIASTSAITVGFVCLVLAPFVPPDGLIFSVMLAVGTALLPAGIISIITSLSSSHVVAEALGTQLDSMSENLKRSISGLEVVNRYLNTSKTLGLAMVHANRKQALQPFLKHLEDYVQRDTIRGESKEIIFIGSSLKGVIEDEPCYAMQLERILADGRKGSCAFHFLLTHPGFSTFREIQEDRPAGGIAKEILHAIAWLEDQGLSSSDIRLYKGTPTTFMIASTERMLVNPYPYEREAYKCFCLELESVPNDESIFASYWTNHFFRPWHGERSHQDHYKQPNSLSYVHEVFEGPIPAGRSSASSKAGSFADFFVINDFGSFYLAVNIRGLESQVPYDQRPDGTYNVVDIGRELRIRLLDLGHEKPCWEDVGIVELNEVRNGFWQGTRGDNKAFEAYSLIGVFDDSHGDQFVFPEGTALAGEPLPLLWKWLPEKTPSQRHVGGGHPKKDGSSGGQNAGAADGNANKAIDSDEE